MAGDADSLIREIDEGAISPMTHIVTRNLYRHISLSDALREKVVAAFDDCSQPHDMAALEAAVWAEIGKTSVENQGGLRLLIGLTRPNEIIDWYLAEFMILWAREEGVTEQHIIDAFHD
ncbi:MAG: hypothetical protein NBV68_03480 [Erythrobacter sp.]|uniref:hypothetical protein n=1 Tax=Erythrobacter sp. TaxID=1042 RepID=UPI0025ED38A8|nr:hypothetical protein [Erythrobacter sp.]MCL9998419.1 hypothetical protein [Erythrobacter sp.]